MEIPKKIKRDKAITIRVKQTTYDTLCKIAKKNKVSQADVVEFLIEQADKDTKPNKK